MTIASEIARLQGVKTDILGAIAEKKVDVPTGAMLADAPDLIRSIKSGINVKIGQGVYPAVKIGNQLWLARNLDEELGTLGADEWYYNGRSEKTRATDFKSLRTITITSSPTQNLAGNWYNWDTGATSGNSIFLRPNKTMYVAMKLTFSSPLVANQSFVFRYWGYRLEQGGSLEQRDFSLGEVQAGSTTAIIIGTETNGLARIGRNLNPTFVVVGNAANTGITITTSEIRICYGTTDCGVDAISVPKAIANEETAKANNYGRLYTWNNVNENIGKLGHTKWRWPTRADFDGLIAIDPTGKKFRSKTFLNGTDDFGLSIVGSGYFNNNAFGGEDSDNRTWSSTETNANNAYNLAVNKGILIQEPVKASGRSVRLVLDLNEDGTIPDSNIVIEESATTAEPLALASEPIVTEEG